MKGRGSDSLRMSYAAIAVGLIMIAVSIMARQSDRDFLESAVRTEAVVVKKSNTGVETTGKRRKYRLTYEFDVDGRRVRGTAIVSAKKREFFRIKTGDPIEIAYAVGEDGGEVESMIVTGRNFGFPVGQTMIGVVFILAGLGLAMQKRGNGTGA